MGRARGLEAVAVVEDRFAVTPDLVVGDVPDDEVARLCETILAERAKAEVGA